MAIYKIEGNNEKLVKVDATSFSQEKIWEQQHLERMLRDCPEVLEDGLLIIAQQYSNWLDSKLKIDLLGLDSNGRLVVIELKKGDTGAHMDLQAIRYAAMVANMTVEQAVGAYQTHLEKRASEPGRDPVEEGESETLLREHLKVAELDSQAIHTEMPRIILASENFGKELTTCVMWLNHSWLSSEGPEIKCVRLQPHKDGDDVLVESSVVIPLPEASDYQTQLKKLEQETRSESSAKAQTHQGADAFEESIKRASEAFQPGLNLLYQAAKTTEQKKIAELSTTVKGENYTINLKVPGHDNVLVTFTNILQYKGKECGGEVAFLPGLADAAPESRLRIEKLIGADVLKNRYRRLSVKKYDWQAILAAIGDVYREASGIPPTQE